MKGMLVEMRTGELHGVDMSMSDAYRWAKEIRPINLREHAYEQMTEVFDIFVFDFAESKVGLWLGLGLGLGLGLALGLGFDIFIFDFAESEGGGCRDVNSSAPHLSSVPPAHFPYLAGGAADGADGDHLLA